jgi:protein TonB
MRDVFQDERLVYRGSQLSWAWRASILYAAAGLACVTAMLMPFSELFTAEPRQTIQFRPVETVTWRPPPPPSPPKPRHKPEPQNTPKPETETPKIQPQIEKPPPKPTRLPVKLDFNLAPMPADLTLNFEIDPTVKDVPEAIVEAPPPAPTPPPPPKPEPRPPDKSPVILTQVQPVYPYRARTRGIEGYVDVRFTVTPDGSVTSPEVLESQPPGLFDHAALRAVERWRFAPAMRGDKAVEARVQIRIRFTLDQ